MNNNSLKNKNLIKPVKRINLEKSRKNSDNRLNKRFELRINDNDDNNLKTIQNYFNKSTGKNYTYSKIIRILLEKEANEIQANQGEN